MEALYFMGIAEFVCIGIIVLFALIGLLRGFAKQIVTLCCWFFALIGAILLVEPVFKLVFAADNAPLHNVLSSFAGVMAFCDGFLGDMAAARGLASGGALAANWIIMLGILLILWILVTIVFKIVKLIFRPFTTIANPIKPVDKILGFLFGAVIGALHIFIFLTIAYLLKDKVAVVGEYLLHLPPRVALAERIFIYLRHCSHSTVTDFARFLGLSMSQPFAFAT